MNKLSWLLYWADTLPSLVHGVGKVFTFLGIQSFFVLVIHLVVSSDVSYCDAGRPLKFALWTLPLCILLALSCNLVPSKDTFYMIAASEAGEAAIQTPEFTKTRQLINKWLDEQIKPDEQEKQQ